MSTLARGSLLGIEHLQAEEILQILRLARRMQRGQPRPLLRGKRMAIIGDIYHSRVARSNIHLLSKFGVQITLCGPPEFVPEVAATLARGLRITRHLEEAIRGADAIMLLRVQKERLAEMSFDVGEYIARYQLNAARLRLAKRDAVVMHPGPIIRGMEISSDVADSPQSLIREEVHNGVAVRMAVLARAMGKAK